MSHKMSTNFLPTKGSCEQDGSMSPDVNTFWAPHPSCERGWDLKGPRRRDVERTRTSRWRRVSRGMRPGERPGHTHTNIHAHTHGPGWERYWEVQPPPRAPHPKEPEKQDSSRNAARGPEQSGHPGTTVSEPIFPRPGVWADPGSAHTAGISPRDPSHLLGLRSTSKGGCFRGLESQPRAYPPNPAGLRTREAEDTDRSGRSRFSRGCPLQGGSNPAPHRWPRQDTFSSSSPLRCRAAPSVAGPTFTLPDNGQQLWPDLPSEVAPDYGGEDGDGSVQLRFENCSPVAGQGCRLEPTPWVPRTNPSARGGLGCHVTGGAERRPTARAAGQGSAVRGCGRRRP